MSTEAKKEIVKRTQIQHFMELMVDSTAKLVRMGNGWTKFDDSSSAQTESTKYINMDTEQEDTTSYKVSYAFECDLMASEETIKHVYRSYKDRKILSDCEVKIVSVDMFDGNKESGYTAYMDTLAIAVSGTSENNNKMKMSGSFNGKGDPVKGKFIPDESGESGTFTPDSVSASANASES